MPPSQQEPPSELLRALGRLVRVLNERRTDYALVGGLGVAVRGPIRATRDIDMVVSVPQIGLPAVLESLSERGFQVDLYEAIRTWRTSEESSLPIRGPSTSIGSVGNGVS